MQYSLQKRQLSSTWPIQNIVLGGQNHSSILKNVLGDDSLSTANTVLEEFTKRNNAAEPPNKPTVTKKLDRAKRWIWKSGPFSSAL